MSKQSFRIFGRLVGVAAVAGAAALGYLLAKKANDYVESALLDEEDFIDFDDDFTPCEESTPVAEEVDTSADEAAPVAVETESPAEEVIPEDEPVVPVAEETAGSADDEVTDADFADVDESEEPAE